jgi:hypothetical protein
MFYILEKINDNDDKLKWLLLLSSSLNIFSVMLMTDIMRKIIINDNALELHRY